MASYHLKKMGKKDFIAKLSEVSGKSKKQAAIDAQDFIKALKLSIYEAEDIQSYEQWTCRRGIRRQEYVQYSC